MSTAEHRFSLLDPSTTTLPDPPAPWICADAFLRDHAAVTRALQVSLSPYSSLTAPSPSALLLRRRNPLAPGSASKPRRKTRPASKRPSPITYITADAANFREMVEWVTGLGSEPPAAEAVMQRVGPSTLDTSAAFLPRPVTAGSLAASNLGPVFPTLESSGAI